MMKPLSWQFKILKINLLVWLAIVAALWLAGLLLSQLGPAIDGPVWLGAIFNILARISTAGLYLLVGLAFLSLGGRLLRMLAPLLPQVFGWEETRITIGEAETKNDFAETAAIFATSQQLEKALEAARQERSEARKHLSDAQQYSLHLGRLIKAFALQSVDYAREGERLERVLQALKGDDREALAIAAARINDAGLRELLLTRAGSQFQAGVTELVAHQMSSARTWGQNYDQLTARLLTTFAAIKGRMASLEAVYSAAEVAGPLAQVQANLDQAMLHLSLENRPGLEPVAQNLPRLTISN